MRPPEGEIMQTTGEAPAPIRVLSVDDHPLLREGIAAIINSEPGLNLVGTASNGREAIEKFRELKPDIALMDLRLPGMALPQFFKRNRMWLNEQRAPASSYKWKRIGPIKTVIGADVHENRGAVLSGQLAHQAEFTFHGRILEQQILDQTS